MIFWIDKKICPDDNWKLKNPKGYKKTRKNGKILPMYVCPVCGNQYLLYESAELAAELNHVVRDYLPPRIQSEIKVLEHKKEINKIFDENSAGINIEDKELFSRAVIILKKMYGPGARFRDGQYEAIEKLVKEKRLLVVQKTGWGKSLVYFISTKILRDKGSGVTLVISPLLALMENQLDEARKVGLKCEALNSSTYARRTEILENMIANKLDLVLTTPETLNSKSIRPSLEQINVGLLVIDEAHCISDWGHDFRLEYCKIYKLLKNINPDTPILATTATATDCVIKDLTEQIGSTTVSRGPLMRDNLSIQVLNFNEKSRKYAWILENIHRLPGTGIIYCLTKRDCISMSDFLQANGINSSPYFAGKNREEANAIILRKFMRDEIKVLVSTVKLGMGFDKPNVSFIIHFQCPKSVITYYQQIGRAARNLKRGKTFLLLSENDFEIHKSFIENAFPSESDMRKIRKFITRNYGCTDAQIMSEIDISRKRLKIVLTFLEGEGLIEKESKRSSGGTYYYKYWATPAEFIYQGEKYSLLKAQRYSELQKMIELSQTKTCYNRFLVNALDDNCKTDCGVCCNCDPSAEFSSIVDEEYIKTAERYLYSRTIEIAPKEFWPRNTCHLDTNNSFTNLVGCALSKYGEDIGYLVKQGKYETHRFDEKLVKRAVEVLQPVIRQYNMTHITCVTSLHSDVVPDFAKRLSVACGLTFVNLIQKTNDTHQKNFNSPSFQFENAWKSFNIIEGAEIPKNLILVDDIVDSGLTLAVCGAKLMACGSEKVYPFALADSSSD